MGDLVYADIVTRMDLPAERILKGAMERNLESVVVVGYDRDGKEYFASSIADGGTVIWLFERMKKALLDIPDDGEDR